MVDGGPAKYDLDLTVQPDNTPGLCKNDVNDNCCTCFKKATEDPGCYKIPCQAYGENPNGSYTVNGYCIGTNDPIPIGYNITDVKCDEEGKCRCWIPMAPPTTTTSPPPTTTTPCEDIWSAKKCKKNKNKCHKPSVAENCCKFCSNA